MKITSIIYSHLYAHMCDCMYVSVFVCVSGCCRWKCSKIDAQNTNKAKQNGNFVRFSVWLALNLFMRITQSLNKNISQ